MSKKSLLAAILYKLGLLKFVLPINRLLGHRLIILAYHRVLNIEKFSDGSFYSDIELVSASTSQFDWQVKYLRDHYNVVTFSQYSEILKTNKRPKDLVVITFDDGFQDNYQNAYQILKKYRVPAVFYISVDYIGSEKPFWFEYLVSVINQLPESHLQEITSVISPSLGFVDRKQLASTSLEYLKGVPNDLRLRAIEDIYGYCESNGITIIDSHSRAMSWEEVSEMSRNEMEIGSQTLSHPILTTLSHEAIHDEIASSKAAIEKKLGISCLSFAYPNGGLDDINDTGIEAVTEAKYMFACSYISGINHHGKLEKMMLKRLHVERYVSKEYFAAMLALPKLFC